jgi:hypothetical protein
MTTKQLSLDDLVRGLEHFGERYEALDVFARDIKEVGHELMERRFGELRPVQGEPAFVFDRSGRTYKLRFHSSGIARLTRAKKEAPGPTESQVALEFLGPAFGVTALDNALPSAVLGFLVGAALGDAADSPKRVFTMSYDPVMEQWHAYDGPLAKLLREKRLEADAALRSAS